MKGANFLFKNKNNFWLLELQHYVLILLKKGLLSSWYKHLGVHFVDKMYKNKDNVDTFQLLYINVN